MFRKHIFIDGIKISYIIAGKGKSILFLHGIGTEASTYSHMIKLLATKYQIIAPDIPFFGHSSSPKKAYFFEDFSELFIKFLERLDLNDVILLGYSFGGGIGARMHNCTRIKKIILCSPAILKLDIDKKSLFGLVVKEFSLSIKKLSNIGEYTIFIKVVQDFLKNIIKCQARKLLADSVINCLNQQYDISKTKRLTLIISDIDPIFLKENYLKNINQEIIIDVKGSHLWAIIKKKEFENVNKLLN